MMCKSFVPLRCDLLGSFAAGASLAWTVTKEPAINAMSDFMASTSSLRQWSDRAQLLHDRVEVCHAPVLGDLTVDDAHCIDGLEADFGACAGDAKKIPSMRAVISLEGSDHVAVDALPMNLRREIWEGFAQALVEGEDAGLVASATGLGRTKKSSAKSSLNKAQFPRPCTSSVLRRTTSLAVSLMLAVIEISIV
jgi:hypothetical protein